MDTKVLPKVTTNYKYPLVEKFEKPLQRRSVKIYKSKHVKKSKKKKISNEAYEKIMVILIVIGLAVCAYSLGYIMGAGIWNG